MRAHPAFVRMRWAAIGAVLAVIAGTGGIRLANADVTTGDKPVFVSITPTRILDTRSNIGLAGRFADAAPRQLQVTGNVPIYPVGTAVVVPAGATGVVMNVTVVTPTGPGFLSVRPGAPADEPSTSTHNFAAGQDTPNSVSLNLPPDGTVQIWFESYAPGGTADVLVDVVGYYDDHAHDDRYYTRPEIDSLLAAPVAGVASIPAAAFTPRFPATTQYEIGSGAQLFATGGTDDTFVAPVDVPNDATLRSMRAIVWDDSTTSIEVRLYRVNHVSPAYDVIYSVVSATDAPGSVELIDTTPTSASHATVSNTTYGYILVVSSPGSWASAFTDLRLHAVVITYDA